MKKISLVAIFVIYSIIAFSQLTVQNGFNAQQLGNNLAGSNISVTNATITGSNVQFGTFHFTGNGFPLSSGVVLTNGSIFDCHGPNNNPGTSTDNNGPGSSLLDAISGMSTHDAVELKFDFTVQSDKIEFNYIFASEEYNEYVGSFNDVFAFFISGPGIVGEENIAVVPNTNVAVAINNINLENYWQYYNNNENGNTNIEFDGYTTVLTAKKTGLIPCQTYTLKLIIADAGDGVYDSGVFLQENSLVQGTVSASTNTYSANDIALEGCINASFTISLDSARLTNTYINYKIGGTAINGIDYTHIDTVLVIPAGQTSASIIIDAKTDGIAEGQESVELIYEPVLCQGYDTIKMYIQDYQMLEFQSIPSDLSCFESGDGQIDFNISGGEAPYSINLTDSATGIVTSYNSYPITNLQAGTYQVQILDAYGCWAEDIVAGAIFDADTTYLPDGNGVSYSTSINISGLPAGQTLVDINQLQSVCLVMEHSFMGDLLIQLQAPNGTLLTLKEQPGGAVTNLGEPVASGPNDNLTTNLVPGVGYQYCFTSNPTYGTMVSESNQHTYTYVSQIGTTLTDKYLPAGTYQSYDPLTNLVGVPLNGTWSIIVTDEIPKNNGYIFNWSISIAADRPDSIVTLNQPAETVVNSTLVMPTCGLNNGSINLSVSGGTPPFTFLWSNGATTQNISNVGAGSHYVTITDNLACSIVKTISLPNSSSATINSTVSNESCVGSNNGSINLTVSGGTLPYSFLWSSGQNTEDISSLSPGSYSVQITDAAGCISASNYEILAASQMFITGTVANENCGNIDGAVDISIIGGASPYSYLWSDSTITQDISNLQQGNYTVTVKDSNNCPKTATFNVINSVGNCVPNCDLVIQDTVIINEVCGNSNGSIQLDIYTTNLPYFTTWSNGFTSEDISGLSAGNYNVTITDAESCSANLSVTVNNIVGSLNIGTVTINDETCGNSNGAINITPVGGVMPYYYYWSNGAITQDISGLSSGSYNLTLTDANSCSIHQAYTVNNNSGTLQLIYGNAMNSDCSLANGSIDISISGGIFPVIYLWSNGATTQDIINLLPGSYKCTITDGSGCSIITPSYVVNSNSGTMAFTYINPKNEVCGNSAGNVKILVNGGSLPYSYFWSNGATTQNIYNLAAGNYSCTVTDNNGCSITTGIVSVINVPGTLALAGITETNEICSNHLGSVQLSITGGVLPYSFYWNTGSTSQNINNLSAGSFTCLVTDSAGCSFNVIANIINEQGTLNIENFIVNNETCGNGTGSINLIMSGGISPLTYNWSNGQTTEDLSSLHSGVYFVTIQDVQGCVVNGSTQVSNQTGNLSLVIQSVSNEVCGNSNGAIDITLAGGSLPYSIQWNSGSTTEDINNLSAGNYFCNVTDNAGCVVGTGNITINNSAGTLSISSSNITAENCGNSNGAIDITVSGGADPKTYLWSNSAVTQDISGLSAGLYLVTVTDANGCTIVGSYTVGQSSGAFQFSNIAINDEVCNNNSGSISLTVSGGTTPYSFLWSNGATTQNITNISSGNYILTITEAGGCSIQTGQITVNNNAGNFSVVSVTETATSCGNSNGSVNVTLTGGISPISYNWNNGVLTQDLFGISSGVYSCTATDNVGCELHYTAIVPNDAGNLTVSGISSNALCGQSNGEINITVNGGTTPYSYLWNNGAVTEDLTGLSAGTYTVFVEDANNCSQNKAFNIQSTGAVVVSAINVTDENCGNSQGGIEIVVGGGTVPYQYNWSADGNANCCNYILEMYDYYGDSWFGATLEVMINGTLFGSYSLTTEYYLTKNIPVCTGDIISLDYYQGTDDYDIIYSLINSNGVTVFNDGPYPMSGNVYTETSSCAIDFPNSNIVNGLSEGAYSVTITDANGCSTSASATVNNVSGGFVISYEVITDDFCNSGIGAIDITVSGGNPPYQYSWSNGAVTQNISSLTEGSYSVDITSSTGCQISGLYTIINNTGTLLFDTAIVTNTYCGNSVGGIDITVSGDELPLSFLWNNGSTSEDLSNIIAGNYIVTITDASGCSINESFDVINQTNGLDISFVSLEPICGNNGGSIDMTITGGVSPYSVIWNEGTTSEDLLNLSEGSYSVTVSDFSGCMTSETVVLNGSSNIVINSMTVNDEYCGSSDGSISVSVSGGDLPYNYQWSLANASPCCSYGMYLYDDVGDGWDGSSVDVFVNGSNVGNYTLPSGTNYIFISIPVCTDDNLQLQYNSGLSDIDNYVYLVDANGNWILNVGPNPGSGIIYTGISNCGLSLPSSSYVYNLSAGDYIVSVTDAGGCSTSDTATVNNITNGFIISSIVKTDEYCNSNNGAIDITVSGGSQPYQYYWNNGTYTQDLNGLSAGTYTVSVYDNNYCMVQETISIINDPGTLAFGSSSITDTYCGSSAGSIDLNVLGDELPFIYNWSNGAITEDLNNILSGDYIVTVVDASGCMIQDTFTVVNQTNGLTLSSLTTNAFCGNNMGSINLTVSGGISPYSIIWSNGSTNEDLNNIAGGIYVVTVTDASSCATTKIMTVTDTGNISVSTINVIDEICNNSQGEITVFATGGTTPYTYSWTQSVSSPCCSYTLEMQDLYGDGWNGGYLEVLINNIQIGMFSAIASGSTEIIDLCSGDQIKLIYTPGDWEEENTYSLLNSGGNNVFSDGPNPATGTVYTGTSSCVFNPPSTNHLTGLSQGEYGLIITEANGCTLDTTITVSNSSGNFNILSANIINDNCGNYTGSIDITVIGGLSPYTYYWSNGAISQDLTNISAGEFIVSVTDNNGCEIIDTNIVTNQTGTLQISNSNVTETYCGNNAGAINITISGGAVPYTYLWSNGATTEDLNSIVSGNYTITLTDNVNCHLIETFNVVNQTNGLSVSYTSINETCNNNSGSIDLTITGGVPPYIIAWSNGSTVQDLTNLNEGNYTFSVTDNSGCIQSETITIQNTSGNMFITLNNIQGDYCGWGYGAINISVQGGNAPISYLWSNGFTSQDISNVVFGSYSVTATDANGCTDLETYDIPYIAIFEVIDTLIQNTSCFSCSDGYIDITTNSGTIVTYQWSNSATTEDIYGLSQGNYTVTMTDEYGCVLIETYNVTYPISIESSENINGIVDVYPNPSKGIVNVSYKMKVSSEVSVEVYNILGEIVYKSDKKTGKEGIISIDLKEGIEGVYTFRIITGDNFIQKKVVLMKM